MVQSITTAIEKGATQLAGRIASAPPENFALDAIGVGLNVPVWRSQLFADLFLDLHVSSAEPQVPAASEDARMSGVKRMGHALRLVCASLQNVRDGLKASSGDDPYRGHLNNVMLHAIRLFDDGSKMCEKMPKSGSDAEGFFMFLATFMARIRVLRENESVIAPCTWASGDDHGRSDHGVFIVLTKTHEETANNYSVAIVNTGDGDGSLGYHGVAVDSAEGLVLRNMAFQMQRVANERIENTAFWFLLFKSTVQPGPKFGAQFLYEKVLPYLASMPVLASFQQSLEAGDSVNDFGQVPQGKDRSFVNCALESLRFVGRAAGLDVTQASHLTMNAEHGLLRLALGDLQRVTSIDASEVDILRMACRSVARGAAGQVDLKAQQYAGMAHDGAGDAQIKATLSTVTDTIVAVEKRLQDLADQKLPLPAFTLTTDQQLRSICEWPFFGRLRRDYDVEKLAGKAPVVPIIRPVEMTLVPDRVGNFSDLATALSHTVSLCVLLANQRAVIRNSYTLRVCMIQHLFTRVVPMPLPVKHPDRNKRCFWHAQPMRHETQADLLRLLNLLSKHFATASLSVKTTRSGDAVRMLTFASMATICDALMRKLACDIPAVTSLHYSGRALGPVSAYAFDLGNLEEETEYLLLTTPEEVATRTQVLDYFFDLKTTVTPDHKLFAFEHGCEINIADKRFIDQICLHMGFDRGLALDYLTGHEDVLLHHYPELGYFRDLVFMFKLVMVPTSDKLPELKQWLPKDATLKWSMDQNKYVIEGFGRRLDCVQSALTVEETQVQSKVPRGVFSKLLRYMGFSGKKPRATPSQANPSILLGERVDTEDDILHVRTLPDFDGTLGARDCELMLQYLTAPYLRIPLLLNFFANEVRLKALRSKALQEVLDAAMFEPGQWKADTEVPLPSQIPAPTRDFLCTPTGLLFNEILMSPDVILTSIKHMLEKVLDMDAGRYSEVSEAILYVARLAIRVEGYLLFLVQNRKFHSEKSADAAASPYNGAYEEAAVRGLKCRDDVVSRALRCQQDIRALLEDKMFKIIARWTTRCKKDGRYAQACVLHAHMAFIFRNVKPDQLSTKVVFALLASQIFLFNNCRYDLDVDTHDHVARKRADVNVDLGIPQVELFDMFQRNRRMVLDWLIAHPAERNRVMDSIVQLVEESQRVDGATKVAVTKHNWVTIEQAGMCFAGRFVPDTEHDANKFLRGLSDTAKTNYEEWLRETTTLSVNTEVHTYIPPHLQAWETTCCPSFYRNCALSLAPPTGERAAG